MRHQHATSHFGDEGLDRRRIKISKSPSKWLPLPVTIKDFQLEDGRDMVSELKDGRNMMVAVDAMKRRCPSCSTTASVVPRPQSWTSCSTTSGSWRSSRTACEDFE